MLQDVPVQVFDMAHASRDFAAQVEARLGRARLMAPILLGKQHIPVLPLSNPDTGVSHHILRIIDSRKESPCHPYKLDLLFQDYDMYFAGFRRAILLLGGEYDWGEWFIYKRYAKECSFPQPCENGYNISTCEVSIIATVHYYHAVLICLKLQLLTFCPTEYVDRSITKIGGCIAMEHMFLTLCKFEDRVIINAPGDGDDSEMAEGGQWRWTSMTSALKADLRSAVAQVIIIFAEALRLRSVYREVLRCMSDPYLYSAIPVQESLWKLINKWGQLSNYVQEKRQEGRLDPEEALPK